MDAAVLVWADGIPGALRCATLLMVALLFFCLGEGLRH